MTQSVCESNERSHLTRGFPVLQHRAVASLDTKRSTQAPKSARLQARQIVRINHIQPVSPEEADARQSSTLFLYLPALKRREPWRFKAKELMPERCLSQDHRLMQLSRLHRLEEHDAGFMRLLSQNQSHARSTPGRGRWTQRPSVRVRAHGCRLMRYMQLRPALGAAPLRSCSGESAGGFRRRS